jgi:1,2-diacylglycerol 3-alpha-glucosyltransferase
MRTRRFRNGLNSINRMKICMMTNTYLPHVGGVARSVSTFADEFRRRGHDVLVVAPKFEGRPLSPRAEAIVERVAAIQNFNGSDFSVRLPLAAALSARIDAFDADIMHAHHPFLLGDTALRIGANRNVPVIFTHHTKYEDYTHYVPFDSPALKQAAINLSTEFANLCDGVIAPSESIARLIRRRGVKTEIAVVPTGIHVEAFASGDGERFRDRHGIPQRAFVLGHVGRLAPEKNLGFLANAAALFLKRAPSAWFVVVGGGPFEPKLREILEAEGVMSRVIFTGPQTGKNLHDAYRSMDVFGFSSCSETQGMVVAEAMAAEVPVVALRAPGVREVLEDGRNGFMLPAEGTERVFAARLLQLYKSAALRRELSAGAAATAARFSRETCAEQALEFYREVRLATRRERMRTGQSAWRTLMKRLDIEWDILARNARTITEAMAS